MLETLEEANRQAHENLEAAQRVADFADRIEGDLQNFQPNVEEANKSLKSFRVDLDQLSKVSGQFSASLSGLTAFQKDLHRIYEQVRQNGPAPTTTAPGRR